MILVFSTRSWTIWLRWGLYLMVIFCIGCDGLFLFCWCYGGFLLSLFCLLIALSLLLLFGWGCVFVAVFVSLFFVLAVFLFLGFPGLFLGLLVAFSSSGFVADE